MSRDAAGRTARVATGGAALPGAPSITTRHQTTRSPTPESPPPHRPHRLCSTTPPRSQLAMTLHRSPTPSPTLSVPSSAASPSSFNSLPLSDPNPTTPPPLPPSTTPPSPTHLPSASRLCCPTRFTWGVEEEPCGAQRRTALPRKPRREAAPRPCQRAARVFASRDERLRDEQIETNTLRRTPQTRYQRPANALGGVPHGRRPVNPPPCGGSACGRPRGDKPAPTRRSAG